VDVLRRAEIMARYRQRVDAFEALAASRRVPSGDLLEAGDPSDAVVELSPRQFEVLQLVADGCTNGEIAQRLWITEETAKTHVRRILLALRAESRAHAVAIGFRNSLIN
jgi:DNA-binding CsgD family transcriptional regulator